MPLSGLERAVLLSISYSSIFSFPLTSQEIWLRLIYKRTISYQRVKDTLSSLVSKKKILTDGKYFTILNSSSFDVRQARQRFSVIKRDEANDFIKKAVLIPFIKAIVVTGSLSVNNAKENDDIDWLIVTQNNTLWIVRPLIIFLAIISGKRRERNGNHRDNSWCFNMFLSEKSLDVAVKNRNIYTAYEVFQADFVYDRANIQSKFLVKNSWVKNYLANYWHERTSQINFDDASFSLVDEKQTSVILRNLNRLLFNIQYQYMKKAITREVVQINKALFHPRNTHGDILTQWKKIIKNFTTSF